MQYVQIIALMFVNSVQNLFSDCMEGGGVGGWEARVVQGREGQRWECHLPKSLKMAWYQTIVVPPGAEDVCVLETERGGSETKLYWVFWVSWLISSTSSSSVYVIEVRLWWVCYDKEKKLSYWVTVSLTLTFYLWPPKSNQIITDTNWTVVKECS